jgi:NTP pyrophosphatase (non-canonical NTP hydrolase)
MQLRRHPAEENLECQRPAPEEAMWDQAGQLYAYHGDVPAEVRLLKLTEEVGEVADAFIGMQGLCSELRK